ncbi:MAG TPA: endonuclease/exonuclease/phosphatase family protein [Mycobacteriales bacterium]|nr:endonuclease/exonuclease/phosphatase family protein [Mycobacteriales bacterium]
MLRSARLLGLVVLVYAVLRLPVAAGAAPVSVTLLQFNMCGNACETRFAVVADLERQIRDHAPQPYVVTLDEVCRGQYDRLVADLRYAGHFEPTIPHRCWDGSDYGIAVLVRTASVELAGRWPLPAPAGGEPRRLACVRDRDVTACVTHLDTDPANTASQVAAVAAHTGAYKRVVVGGDFNAPPGSPAMAPLYRAFREVGGGFTGGCSAARCGARPGWAHPTRKIDYIFGTFPEAAARTGDAPHSDHVPLWATAILG